MKESNLIGRVQTPIIPTVAELIRQNPGTISLGQGVVSYPPPPQVFTRAAIIERESQLNKYQAVHGIPELLQGLQDKLASDNAIDLSAISSRLFVTAGGNMAFVNALLAIVEPGDEVILQVPYYFNHEMAITMASCKPVLVPVDQDAQLQPELIGSAITSRTRAVVTISPNNPTGAVYTEAALREVNEICRRHGIYHISDEAYEYFTYDDVRHFSPGSIRDSEEYTISLFSFSKSHGMASWRVGYMVVPEHLFPAINKIQDTILICPPVTSQLAAVGALEAGNGFVSAKVAELSETRRSALESLQAIEQAHISPAFGAFYFLLQLQTDIRPLDLVTRLIREHGVAAIPGDAFGFSGGCQLRVSYGALESATVNEGVGRLVDGLQSILGRETS